MPQDYMARKHGKKVQTHDSRAIPGQSILVDIRMDHGGRFSACWNEVWFDSLELPQLRKMLDAAIAKSGPTQWDLYIEIHEIGEPREESPWRNEERAKVVLDYKLLNLSQEITGKDPHYPGETTYRLCKKVEVEKDGKLKIADEITQYHEGDETVLLPYTAERWAALERLAETIEHVALQLRKLLFTAKPTAIAHTLDTIAPQRLLTALSDEPLPQKVKKR